MSRMEEFGRGLWHATSGTGAQNIPEKGFDPKMVGEWGADYGAGVYATESLGEAMFYAETRPGGRVLPVTAKVEKPFHLGHDTPSPEIHTEADQMAGEDWDLHQRVKYTGTYAKQGPPTPWKFAPEEERGWRMERFLPHAIQGSQQFDSLIVGSQPGKRFAVMFDPAKVQHDPSRETRNPHD